MSTLPESFSTDRPPLGRRPRDARLDFWRGICLVDMVLVHLLVQGLEIGHYPHAILGEYTRFAAGGFIFIAGLGVGHIFLPKARERATRRATYLALLRRAFYILCVHYTATLGFMVFSPLRGEPLPPVHLLLRDILLFREGNDLLPFYVVMMALTPAMLELVRRRLGWALGVASVALFAWGRDHHLVEAIYIQQTFFVVLWQAIFVAGLLFGAAFPAYDALSRRAKAGLAAGATVATLALSALAYGWHFNLLPKNEWFVKVPLSPGETVRYLAFILALITVTDLLWGRIRGGAVERFVTRLGRRSLAMYVTHAFVVGLMVPLSYRDGLSMTAHLAYIPVAVGALWLVAWAMDAYAARDRARAAQPAWQFRGWGVAATACTLALFLGAWAHVYPLGDPGARPDTEQGVDWGIGEPAFLTRATDRFPSPVTPGILPPHDGPEAATDEVEVATYACVTRTGRASHHGVGGSSFRRQL